MSSRRIATILRTDAFVNENAQNLRSALEGGKEFWNAADAATGINHDRFILNVHTVETTSEKINETFNYQFNNPVDRNDIRIICTESSTDLDLEIVRDNRLVIIVSLGAGPTIVKPLPLGIRGCEIQTPLKDIRSTLMLVRLELAIARSGLVRHVIGKLNSDSEKQLFERKAKFFSRSGAKTASLASKTPLSYAPLALVGLDQGETTRQIIRGAVRSWDEFLISEYADALPNRSQPAEVLRVMKIWRKVGGQLGVPQAKSVVRRLNGDSALSKEQTVVLLRLARSVQARVSPDIKNKLVPVFGAKCKINDLSVVHPDSLFKSNWIHERIKDGWIDALRVHLRP